MCNSENGEAGWSEFRICGTKLALVTSFKVHYLLKHGIQRLHTLLGKRVELDALAWDRGKGISGRVVLPSGDSVYVIDPFIRRANGNYELRIPQGKLVRLVGVLTFEQVQPPKPTATNVISQGYQAGFSYMALALESFTVIDRAEHEFPQLRPK